MGLSKKVDYVEQGLDRLLQQYKDKPKIAGIVTPWLVWFQKFEDICWEIITLRYIDTGEGVQLDTIGKILDAPRPGGMVDFDYKIRLKARAIVLRSDGTPPKIQKLLQLCCPLPFTQEEFDVATLVITLHGIVAGVFDVNALFETLAESKMGGVRLELVYQTSGLDHDLRFAAFDPDDPDYLVDQFDADHCFADEALTVGGNVAAVEVA